MSILLKEARAQAIAELAEGPSRECECCHTPFVAAKGFERLCPVCFKIDRGYDLYVGDKALLRLQEQYHKQAAEMAQLTDRYTRVRQKAKSLMQAAASPLTAKKVEKLIRLCHPDKHGGSALATEVTQWLLSQRRK
jgi:hypothetical protein